ncbi:hypothetical protein AALP_AA8G357500 [Arabis alpina]|uniref:Uncharacterized protein n=1 Tax=Arabis alpina TaxID=50452 RepID=A0A087GBJ8_ARAAL|nr:hypothetical protein AALP_AA8G357500 [Arabis alpina]
MLGLLRPEVINLFESKEMSDDMGGLNLETTWGTDEREESMETEREEDHEEDPEEEPMDGNEKVKPVLGSKAIQLPTAEPKSPVYIEISSDSAMSLELKDSPVPVESRIPMPPGPIRDFPLISANKSQPALGSIFDDSPGLADYWRDYTGDMHQFEAYKSWWNLNIPQAENP